MHDSFATYACSCRICLVEFFIVFNPKNSKKGEESAYTGDLKDLLTCLASKPHYQYENPISHLFPLFSSYKSSGEDL